MIRLGYDAVILTRDEISDLNKILDLAIRHQESYKNFYKLCAKKKCLDVVSDLKNVVLELEEAP